MEEEGKGRSDGPIFRDIRRYYCEYCGICRSKKALIASHIISHHQEDVNVQNVEEKKEVKPKSYTCEECGACFRKPAYLKQHMLSHLIERPFMCPIDDCNSSYRRKDHLNRHLLHHQGKLFKCPKDCCDREFTLKGNVTRHMKEFHGDDSTSDEAEFQKHVCQEIGCGKVFKFASRLRKHVDSHVKLNSVEAICSELDCMKYFPNEECLKAHLRSNHRYITCDICGTKQLKKNIKRHLRIHGGGCSYDRIKCGFPGCLHTFSTQSNLNQHVKAVHLELRPFPCRIAGCGLAFPFKHVRDNHEKTSLHNYTHGDFVLEDEKFRLKPRGGRKRQCPTVESLVRKRVTSTCLSDFI